MTDNSEDLAEYLGSLIAKINPGMARHHDKLNSLEHTMRVEYDGLYRHMDHVKAIAENLHEEAAARLTEIAKTMGYVPAPLPPPLQQMRVNDNHDMPRVVRQTPAERTVDAIYGLTG